MKKKRILALTLSAVMAVMTVGCGNGGSPAASNAPAGSSSPAAESTAPVESGTPAESAAPDEAKYDYGGVVVKAWGGDFDNLAKDDAELKFKDAKEYVDKKYNIDLQGVKLAGHDGGNEAQLLMSSVASGDPAADLVILPTTSLISCINNKLLFEITPYLDQFKVGSAYTNAMTWDGKCYGISYDNLGSTWVMVYDRDLVKKIGMEKTPTEMFMEGKWDYTNFKKYLADMKSKLPKDVYPIGAYPYHWATMAGAANGAIALDSKGHLAYTDEPFLEAVQLYRDLQKSGLAAPATKVKKDDGTTGFDFPYATNDETIVLKRAEAWELQFIEYNFGVVPYPWGSNVKLTGDDYTTLDENYKASIPYWAGVSVMESAVDRTGIPGEVLTMIGQDFESQANDKTWMTTSYEQEKAGGEVIFSANPGEAGALTTEEDIEIIDWLHTRFDFDWAWSFDAAGMITVWDAFKAIYGEGKDPRATLESYYNEAQAKMKDAGLIK